MAAIGSLVFCTDCGNLLEADTSKKTYIECDVCGTQNKDTSSKVVVTSSKPTAFPSTLRTRLRTDLQELAEGDMQTDAIAQETCEKCGNDEARFYQLQIRSADEGSTIFYTCQRCGHKWKTDN